ncbi:MAG: OmpA family protein [Terriglobia bacterium]
MAKYSAYVIAATAGTVLCSGMLFTTGCAKKVAVATPPPVVQQASSARSVAGAEARRAAGAPASQRTTARVASRMPDQATRDQIAALLKRIEDAYFDYNTSDIRADASQALTADARTLSQILSQYPSYKLTVEGYCDERGSAEYNLALGEARAQRARAFLTTAGIPPTQLLTVSYGKERQTCAEHDESCWRQNRRIHITQAQG